MAGCVNCGGAVGGRRVQVDTRSKSPLGARLGATPLLKWVFIPDRLCGGCVAPLGPKEVSPKDRPEAVWRSGRAELAAAWDSPELRALAPRWARR